MVLAGHFTTWLDALNALAQENALGSRGAPCPLAWLGWLCPHNKNDDDGQCHFAISLTLMQLSQATNPEQHQFIFNPHARGDAMLP